MREVLTARYVDGLLYVWRMRSLTRNEAFHLAAMLRDLADRILFEVEN